MPERRDSIDSFDDFFGEQKKTETEPIRKPSPAPSTPFRKSKNRPPTPPTPEERVETPWKIPTKSDRTAAPVKSPPPPPPESVHSNDYESGKEHRSSPQFDSIRSFPLAQILMMSTMMKQL